ncbi:WD repeat-containing protein WRAP73 [Hondaea fermentalgiana]|uniref:WD repeat-containing protein WRAP73 n=1 Tax=Hondaea fermentalgiana TaxID=2315210 RepID=A0A2R5GDR0_9STRA|nr:WD repeat-containing protein WRAP73 [Hondaea fermentalgiana]|eukprot:GBG28459.1 WD repeat-containing protein WRAP73 [Hondaea fermentalgiana]
MTKPGATDSKKAGAASAAEKAKASAPKKPKFTVRTSHGLAKFSPDGQLAAFASGTGVVVVRVPTIERGTGNEAGGFKVECRFSCVDTVESIDWSADSLLVVCAQYKRALVQVFSVQDRTFTCRVSEGVGGLVHAALAPDGRHLVTIADFQLHLSVWSLVDETQRIFMNPKLPTTQGCRFSADGEFMAVAHRRECKDSVAVYSTSKGRWAKLQHFTVASTDLEEIVWSADNDAIIVRDCPIEYRLLVYNPADGSLLARYSAYEHALGIKTIAYSNASKFAAVGSFDNVCRVLNTMTWRPIAECEHPNSIVLRNSGIRWISQRAADQTDQAQTPALTGNNANHSSTGVHKFVVVKPDMKKPLPKSGIGLIAWSFDGQFLATRDDQKPFVIWIWKMDMLSPFAVLELSSRVNSFKWDPCQIRLAIASGDACAYMWTPQCENELIQAHAWSPDPSDPVPSEGVLGIKWSSAGDTLLLLSKTQTAFALVN